MRKLITMLMLAAMVFAFSGCGKSDEEKAEDALKDAQENVEKAGKDAKEAADEAAKDAKKALDNVLGD